MPITPNIVNPQDMEVVVSGPGGANRLFIYSGMAQFYLADYSGATGWPVRDTLTFLVGPTFSAGQVQKAIAVGAVSGVSGPGPASGGTGYQVGVSVDSIDADWDDDSGQVRVTANLAVWGASEILQGLGFQATVLAAVSE
jgi:hypothetical protein